ncbi:MAG: hypothetical protein ABJC88_16830 [Parasphingorhabdus sp.]|uniref:hypothetical protein n=1 Tax=Sphingomonadales TaxID=204457 RepID=UPI00326316A9
MDNQFYLLGGMLISMVFAGIWERWLRDLIGTSKKPNTSDPLDHKVTLICDLLEHDWEGWEMELFGAGSHQKWLHKETDISFTVKWHDSRYPEHFIGGDEFYKNKSQRITDIIEAKEKIERNAALEKEAEKQENRQWDEVEAMAKRILAAKGRN